MLEEKVSHSIGKLNQVITSQLEIAQMLELSWFHQMLQKHIDLVDRRILKSETIAASEKIYSLFEPHTEWIVKGKAGVITELGHNVLVATDEPGFIVHHLVAQGTKDVKLAQPVAQTLKKKFGDRLAAISFDKGFYSQPNKENIQKIIPTVVMPKRGKRNQSEYDEEHQRPFKKLKNAHSAVESNINQLEHHGLNRCPDKGLKNFKKYVSLGVLAYNLHKLGNLIAVKNKKRKKRKHKLRQAA
jgi:transposase, IS5 family